MKRILLAMLRFYKRNISPLLPNACRFTPTCSEYAMEAIQKHGALKGTGLAIWRVLRCNPFCKGGYDPVPEPKKHKESIS
ncbi:MAG: membrane protein insertion efficiency factor YidD [Clostridia bacterium]|nr:membrane protein insertion efficiency factor YidD [Clostridia bacterium]